MRTANLIQILSVYRKITHPQQNYQIVWWISADSGDPNPDLNVVMYKKVINSMF